MICPYIYSINLRIKPSGYYEAGWILGVSFAFLGQIKLLVQPSLSNNPLVKQQIDAPLPLVLNPLPNRPSEDSLKATESQKDNVRASSEWKLGD